MRVKILLSIFGLRHDSKPHLKGVVDVPAVRPLHRATESSTTALAASGTAVLEYKVLAVARKRARRSGLVQFFAVYQFDRGGILQMCHTVGELCNHAVRGSVVWRLISDTICEFTVNSVF